MIVLVVIGVIVVGGFLWKLISVGIGMGRAAVTPGAMENSGPFWIAWEERHGPVIKGDHSTYPPQGLYPRYLKQNKKMAISPAEFLQKAGY